MWDSRNRGTLNDSSAIRVLEMLLDRYHYKDPEVVETDSPTPEGFEMVLQSIAEDLPDIPEETIVKILGVIHFVARRRTRGGREYFDIVHKYAGLRGGPGIRILPDPLE